MSDEHATTAGGSPLLRRLAETGRASVAFTLDGRPCSGLVGDTVLTALLTHGAVARFTEFSGEARAGFCMMGACQDCWVATESGQRLRACSTFLAEGMRLSSRRGSAP
jgi:predicted molibdopterin-dependent oxidoreductase YjgC